VLTAVTSVSEAIFLQLILFAITATFFYSLLGFVSHCFEKATAVRKLARDGVASKRSIRSVNFGSGPIKNPDYATVSCCGVRRFKACVCFYIP